VESLKPYGIVKLVMMATLLHRGNYTAFKDLEEKSRLLADLFINDGAADTAEAGNSAPNRLCYIKRYK